MDCTAVNILALQDVITEGSCTRSLMFQQPFCLVIKSCPTLCDPIDCSQPGPSVHGISQARMLEWFAIFFSRESPDPGIQPGPPTLQVDSLPTELSGKRGLVQVTLNSYLLKTLKVQQKEESESHLY